MTPHQALSFIKKHGVVLESAHGPVPSLAEFITGSAIVGSWWAHSKGREIFAVTRAIRDHDDVLVCRVVQGKVTFVHRRVLPALVRAASQFSPDRISRVREVHTRSGRHVIKEQRFPAWVPSSVRTAARDMPEGAAIAALGAWATNGEATSGPTRRWSRRA